ncbi:ATP--guanido phosphotransferase [Treponema phagedenis]|uniref:ATP:guanido phosphotransferase, C-terminal catalytic domain protein n=1 Tax=Treponema phagedenis TaxID=162 RepID=A0A0B7GSL6_TREPH|nr:hypothetical protein [Treponema phagedenis]QEK01031.1 ATP--guanido phosphotransferase [Treponema phagedenis]QSH94553.1 ATP--guanido phosphotransferase [Treponema phagedenis]QSH99520.1 ATP--guanido phosphotransferase [Treponema phagedenis]CEM61609.1 ATP:guanido phosphotransferase, C-terminal catalytic domain protein [Treponema phagedenis]
MITDSSAWYMETGPDIDIVLSTKVGISRNLLDFVFPSALNKEDAERVTILILDAFNQLPDAEKYNSLRLVAMDTIGKKILEERGILASDTEPVLSRAVIIHNDGAIAATSNIRDHLHLLSFSAGFAPEQTAKTILHVENILSKYLRFAAVKHYGYLTSNIYRIGSGMKNSILCSLPGLSLTGILQEEINKLAELGFEIHAYYAADSKLLLGWLYLISYGSSAGRTVKAQISFFHSYMQSLIEKERTARNYITEQKIYQIKDIIAKALALAKNAVLLDIKEAIDITLKIKLGISLNLIRYSSIQDCNALLYRVQTAHLAFLLLSGALSIDEDIPFDEIRVQRMRAIFVKKIFQRAELNY